MRKNLSLYPWYYAASSFIGWMPVFFLYFSEYVGLKEVLLLESIYYLSVVILEVPSGYFSDVFGRKVTLIISAVFLLAASVAFVLGSDFNTFVIGQICFAVWMAFQSGTNTVFHFESLKALGLEAEYGDREATVGQYGFYSGGIAAFLGGWLGSYNLRYAFAITIVAAMVAVVTTLMFTEPDRDNSEDEQSYAFGRQLMKVFKYFTLKPLGWLFAYLIFIYAIAHIPYEFYQPYLKLLENQDALAGTKAPFVSGLLYALTLFVGAFVSGRSMIWARKFGIKNTLLGALILMVAVIAFMGTVLHPALVLIVLLRSAPRSLIKAPTNAIITPLIKSGQRATLFSVISLISRFVFFAALSGLSFIVAKETVTDWETLSLLLKVSAGVGALIALPFLLTASRQALNLEGQVKAKSGSSK